MECVGRRCRSIFRPNTGSFSRRSSSLRRGADALPKPPRSHEAYTVNETDGGSRDVIKVKSVDLCLEINGTSHKTDQFDVMIRDDKPCLVVRRGQPFRADLKLSRQFSLETDAMSFIFTVAGLTDSEVDPEEDSCSCSCSLFKNKNCTNRRKFGCDKPNYGQGTLIAVPLLAKHSAYSTDDSGLYSWSAHLVQSIENILTVEITPAADCVVGQWKMDIDTKLKEAGSVSYTHKQNIYILFNPWCPEDIVYMEREEERREYTIYDTGLIYRGSYNRIRPSVWKYAQYEKDVLDCSLYLITKVGRVSYSSCSDPVKIVRALSAAVNSPDDNGCLLGNWTSEFDGGTPPTKWIGSMRILQKYYKYKKPVKYGQCWVFSGVLTTICRAIGIPCRPVTTYCSAHDTQNSLTVDYFVDENGEIMEELNSDSIWNFHVWNEVWMKRRDLGSLFDGWQAIDATPQELSDDMYRCGPASVTAVKQGEVLRPYDAAFVYAEVNADKVFWRYNGPTQPLKLLNKDMHGIGQMISTKAIGLFKMEDITDSYKFPEKSKEERTAMLKALKQSESLFSRYYLNEEFNDIKFDFKLRDDIVIGSPFSVVLAIENRNEIQDYTIVIQLRVDTVTYTGKMQDPVKKEKSQTVVKKGTTQEISMKVAYDEYVNKLVDQCAFNIACLALVKDTNFEYFAQDDFRVRKPDIKIKVDGEAIQGQVLQGTACLTNPLPVNLKKGLFIIEGPGLDSQLKIKVKDVIAPKEDVTVSFQMTPKTSGRKTIAAKFVSNELDDVDGFINLMVKEKQRDGNGFSNNKPK